MLWHICCPESVKGLPLPIFDSYRQSDFCRTSSAVKQLETLKLERLVKNDNSTRGGKVYRDNS